MKGTINSIKNRTVKTSHGDEVVYDLEINGKKYSTFLDCSECKVGDDLDFTYKENGKYLNIILFKRFEQSKILPAPIPPFTVASELPNTKDKYWEKKDRYIIRQNVLNRATELYIAGKVTSLDEMYALAEELELWVTRD